MAVDNEGVQVLGNIHEPDGMGQQDQREAGAVRQLTQLFGHLVKVGADLDAEAGGILLDQLLHITDGMGSVQVEAYACSQDHFAAVDEILQGGDL
ncbi:hypothetical protein D3C75_782670 [compost metagenome]